jgi:hypothetical protein
MIKVDISMLQIPLYHAADQLHATFRPAGGHLKDIISAIKILPGKFIYLDKRVLHRILIVMMQIRCSTALNFAWRVLIRGPSLNEGSSSNMCSNDGPSSMSAGMTSSSAITSCWM